MAFDRPVIVSGETKLDKGFFENTFDGVEEGILAPGWRQRSFGGAIRNLGSAGGYWQPISDGAHWPWGIDRVETTTVGIDIYYQFDLEVAGIGTVIVSPDETLSSEGWKAGASVEREKCTLKLSRHKTISDQITWNGTAWTVTAKSGFTSATWSTSGGGQLVLQHEKMFGHGYSVTTRGREADAVISTSGASNPQIETRIQLFNPTTGAQIATTAEIPANLRVYVSRMDSFPGGSINPQSAPDQTELPNSNLWLFGVHHVAPRPIQE